MARAPVVAQRPTLSRRRLQAGPELALGECRHGGGGCGGCGCCSCCSCGHDSDGRRNSRLGGLPISAGANLFSSDPAPPGAADAPLAKRLGTVSTLPIRSFVFLLKLFMFALAAADVTNDDDDDRNNIRIGVARPGLMNSFAASSNSKRNPTREVIGSGPRPVQRHVELLMRQSSRRIWIWAGAGAGGQSQAAGSIIVHR